MKKNNWKVIIIIFAIAIINFLISFNYSKIIYRKEINTAQKYLKEKYNIESKVSYPYKDESGNINLPMDSNGYSYYVIVKNGRVISDSYMNYLLGYSFYDELVSNLEKTFNTKVIEVDKKNNIYIGYYDSSAIDKSVKKEDIFANQTKDIELNFTLAFKDNSILNNEEIADKFYAFVKDYLKNKNIDYSNINIYFLNDTTKIKDINDIYSKFVRSIEMSESKITDTNITSVKQSIFVRDEGSIYHYNPFDKKTN